MFRPEPDAETVDDAELDLGAIDRVLMLNPIWACSPPTKPWMLHNLTPPPTHRSLMQIQPTVTLTPTPADRPVDASHQDASTIDAGNDANHNTRRVASLFQGSGLNCQSLPFSPGSVLVMLFFAGSSESAMRVRLADNGPMHHSTVLRSQPNVRRFEASF